MSEYVGEKSLFDKYLDLQAENERLRKENDELTEAGAMLERTIAKLRTGNEPCVHREWRCFHCDEVFTDLVAAREHFGPHELADAACTIDITEYRRMEKVTADHCAEDTELHRALHRKDAEIGVAVRRAEEQGYARGLEDAKKHPETLGLQRASQPPGPRSIMVPTNVDVDFVIQVYKREEGVGCYADSPTHPGVHVIGPDFVSAATAAAKQIPHVGVNPTPQTKEVQR